jgi:hypothetical protein
VEVTRRGFIHGIGAACLLTVVKPDEVRKLLEEQGAGEDIHVGTELWFPIEFDVLDCEVLTVKVNGVLLKEGVHYHVERNGKWLKAKITHCPDDALNASEDTFHVEVADLGAYGWQTEAVPALDFNSKKCRPQPKKRQKSLRGRRV